MANFIPTNDWQEISPDDPMPPGLDYRMDMDAGISYARLHQNGTTTPTQAPSPAAPVVIKPTKRKPKSEIILRSRGRGETGDAELFAEYFGGSVTYDHSEGLWYRFTGQHWEQDKTGQVYRLVSNNLAAMYLSAGAREKAKGNDEESKKYHARANELHNRRRVENVLFLAARLTKIALTGEEWDADPWLLAVQNGVVDLRTGTFRTGNPDDYNKSVSPTQWTGIDTPAPRFEKFMLEIFNGDQVLVDFMQRLFGYGITGLTREHVLPILYGPEGRNGKGTLLEVLADVLGNSLAISSQADALMDMNRQNGNGPQPFVYALRGKRLVWASESDENRKINSSLVKKLTGGDRLNVRTLNAKPIEFSPTHLILLITNHKPNMTADDQALWDRVLLIPFICRFVDNPAAPNEYKRDPELKDKLKEEAPGILAWLVRGCLEWQKQGLNPPQSVKQATDNYHEEEKDNDPLEQFIEEKCTLADGLQQKSSSFYAAFVNWARANGMDPHTQTRVGKRMKQKFDSYRNNGIYYLGIQVNP